MPAPRHVIRVCKGLACCGRFSEDLYDEAMRRAKGCASVAVESCECQNLCDRGPNVFVDRAIHHEVTTEQIAQWVDRCLGTVR